MDREVGTVEHRVDAELRGAKGPNFPVLEGAQHVDLAKLTTRRRVSVIPLMSQLHECLFILIQKVRRIRIVGQRKIRHNTQRKARNALNNHDPPPARHAMQAIHMPNAIRQQTPQRTRNRGTHKQVPHTQRELMFRVEESQVDVETGEEAGLDGAEEQTAREQRAVRVDEARQRGDEAPGGGDEGDPAAGREDLEDEVGGNLEEEVGDEEDGDGDLELLRGEAEVFL